MWHTGVKSNIEILNRGSQHSSIRHFFPRTFWGYMIWSKNSNANCRSSASMSDTSSNLVWNFRRNWRPCNPSRPFQINAGWEFLQFYVSLENGGTTFFQDLSFRPWQEQQSAGTFANSSSLGLRSQHKESWSRSDNHQFLSGVLHRLRGR